MIFDFFIVCRLIDCVRGMVVVAGVERESGRRGCRGWKKGKQNKGEQFRFPRSRRHGEEREESLLSPNFASLLLSFLASFSYLLTLNDSVMGSGLTASDVSVTARVGDFHSGDGEGDSAAAAASAAASGAAAAVAMPLEACAASLPGTCFVSV